MLSFWGPCQDCCCRIRLYCIWTVSLIFPLICFFLPSCSYSYFLSYTPNMKSKVSHSTTDNRKWMHVTLRLMFCFFCLFFTLAVVGGENVSTEVTPRRKTWFPVGSDVSGSKRLSCVDYNLPYVQSFKHLLKFSKTRSYIYTCQPHKHLWAVK